MGKVGTSFPKRVVKVLSNIVDKETVKKGGGTLATPKVGNTKEANENARRRAISEKRRSGRRTSILANVAEEEAKLAGVKRPGGRSSKLFFGS